LEGKTQKSKGGERKRKEKGMTTSLCILFVCACVLRKFDFFFLKKKNKNKNGGILLPSRPTIFPLADLGVEEEPLERVCVLFHLGPLDILLYHRKPKNKGKVAFLHFPPLFSISSPPPPPPLPF
jgi:hypothetical protein